MLPREAGKSSQEGLNKEAEVSLSEVLFVGAAGGRVSALCCPGPGSCASIVHIYRHILCLCCTSAHAYRVNRNWHIEI